MSQLIKVIFEYSNGTQKYINGSELEKWMSFNAIALSSAESYGVNPPWNDVKWNISNDKKSTNK